MALGARYRLVSTLERERCTTVAECRRLPDSGRMTGLALMTEVSSNVIGVLRLGELRLMARIAIGVNQLIVPVHMALLALCRLMGPRQGEVRRIVIE